MRDIRPRRASVPLPTGELLLHQRLTSLRRALAGARRGEVEAIHQSRVATRRLREALPLVARASRAHKLERKVRRLTRALGPLRELDVALGMLQELEETAEVPHLAIDCLRQSMLQERRGLHAAAVKAIDRWTAVSVRRKSLLRGDGVAIGSPLRRAARRADRLSAAVASAAGIYLPDRLHDVRIAVKKLRYTIEMRQGPARRRGRGAGERQPSLRTTSGQLALLKRVQEMLGRMHDLEVLIARARAVQSSSSGVSLRASGDLDQLVRRLETECRQLHGHYMAARAGLLTVCERVTADARRAEDRMPAA